jgi:hypothetical protein
LARPVSDIVRAPAAVNRSTARRWALPGASMNT